jgi:uncharacterized iron-regulated protein
MRTRLVLFALLAACGGRYGNQPAAQPARKKGIESAALPYSILDRSGHQVPAATFWNAVAASRVVCVGEDHPNPHHHWFQLEVVSQLVAHKHAARLALGMEMFQRPFQAVLDDYAAKRIDDAALISRSGWEDRWGYDFGFYGPTMAKAMAAGAALVALNASKELTKKVVHKGLEALTPDERRQVPELVLDDKAHRAWFDQTMDDMGGSEAHGSAKEPSADDKQQKADKPTGMPSAERIYTAQVLWDETMADGAARWSKAAPNGTMVVLAGNGHCHDSAMVNRIKRRGVEKVISIRPVLDVEGRVAEALAKPMNDYVVVLELPKDARGAMTP